MATIYLAVEVERIEGKTMSNDLVGQALVDEFDNIGGVDVEDSIYGVLTVEVIASPKSKKQELGDEILLKLDEVGKTWALAFPTKMEQGSTSPYENLTDAQLAFVRSTEDAVLFSPGLGEAILKAKIRREHKKRRGVT